MSQSVECLTRTFSLNFFTLLLQTNTYGLLNVSFLVSRWSLCAVFRFGRRSLDIIRATVEAFRLAAGLLRM